MDQYIGKLLDNRYEILELIGVGGMARVYKARCHRLNRFVAVKILRDDLAQDAELRRRFHEESQAVAMLSHPNIVAVYDVSRSSELEYIVMELIDGITLKQYMERKGNKLNWREALHFITQITKALSHAHSRGIIHRDIKPHNIMILRDGSVKVADFGIARVTSGGHSTLTQEALGSVHYISPEQARGSHIDARSDLYSAGVVLYEMITGRLPFEGDTPVSVAIQHINSIPLSPREIDDTIPEALEEITMKAMAPNPDNRYLSAREMLADLEEFRKNPNVSFDYGNAAIIQEAERDADRTQIHTVAAAGHAEHGGRAERSGRSERPERSDWERKDSYSSSRRGRQEEPEEEEEEEERRRSVLPIVGTIAAILIFLGGLFALLYTTVFSGLLSSGDTFEVPKLEGYTYEEVKDDTDLLQDHFTVVLGPSISSEEPEGTILSQDPAAGEKVKESVTEITVTVSAGPEETAMIDVEGMNYQSAIKALEEMGLKVVTPITYEASDEVMKDRVIRQDPAADEDVQAGDEVKLVVSSGPKANTDVTVISFVGQKQSWAENKLELLNLKCKIISSYSDKYAKGVVIDQNPKEGSKVAEGSTVNLEVSLGPDPSVPVEHTKTIQVPIPEDKGDTVSIRVVMDGSTVFQQSVDTLMTMGDVSFDVTSSGKKTLSVYYNGTLDHTMTVDFG